MKLKKIFIIIVILLILILLGFGIYFLYKYLTPVTVNSINNEFSLQIPGKVDFKETASGSADYVLDLYSVKDQMMLYTTRIENTGTDVNLKDAITAEKDNISNARENVKDLSDIIEMSIPNCEAYKYSFTYYDLSLESDLYSNVVWIKTSKNIYILDFEVILANKDKYVTIFDDIANSFVEN